MGQYIETLLFFHFEVGRPGPKIDTRKDTQLSEGFPTQQHQADSLSISPKLGLQLQWKMGMLACF